MTTDIEALIAEARKYGPESMSSKLIAKLADALESRQSTTREKLAQLIRAELAKDREGFGSCDFGKTLADAVLAADVFVDADKIAADAWDEGFTACDDFVAGPDWAAQPTNPYRAPVTAPTETEKPDA